ncbi:MAG: DUF4177 domain-containing protein [Thermodesulfobacteriota bacterium]
MRWSYKNVHYGLKKEGLLGSGFLDEAEVEQSLNEYGRAGWELVSLIEIHDGLLAIFKQPLGEISSRPEPVQKAVPAPVVKVEEQIVEPEAKARESSSRPVIHQSSEKSETGTVNKQKEENSNGIGSIRIE